MALALRVRYLSAVSEPARCFSIVAVVCAALLAGGCGRARELREWTPEDHQPPPGGASDRAPVAEDADPEATLFGSRCASCHGAAGRGDGMAAPGPVPDFTDPELQSGRTDEALARVIVEGRGLMPAFGDELTEAGVAAMVRYVRRLGGVRRVEPAGAEGGVAAGAEP